MDFYKMFIVLKIHLIKIPRECQAVHFLAPIIYYTLIYLLPSITYHLSIYHLSINWSIYHLSICLLPSKNLPSRSRSSISLFPSSTDYYFCKSCREDMHRTCWIAKIISNRKASQNSCQVFWHKQSRISKGEYIFF